MGRTVGFGSLRRLLAATLCVAGLAGGCAGGSQVEAIYTLSPVDAVRAGGATRAQLLVPEPAALASLDTERIAVRPTPESLAYYERVAWADTVPKVFQALLLESLQNTGRVGAVGLPGQSLLIDYQLVAEIRHFEAETFAGDRARVVASVKILNDRNGRVVAERLFEGTAPMSGDGPAAAAEAVEAAAQALIADVVAWVLATV